MRTCSLCLEFIFGNDSCRCALFSIDHEGEIYQRRGLDHEDAAEKWAIAYNEGGDYSLMNETVQVLVSDENGNKQSFNVSAEPDIHYSIQATPND